jgi:hypothetical protein
MKTHAQMQAIKMRDASMRDIRQHTPAYASMRQHAPAYASIRQHTSAGDASMRDIAPQVFQFCNCFVSQLPKVHLSNSTLPSTTHKTNTI